MKVTLEGTPKEIADLVLEIQSRRKGVKYTLKIPKIQKQVPPEVDELLQRLHRSQKRSGSQYVL